MKAADNQNHFFWLTTLYCLGFWSFHLYSGIFIYSMVIHIGYNSHLSLSCFKYLTKISCYQQQVIKYYIWYPRHGNNWYEKSLSDLLQEEIDSTSYVIINVLINVFFKYNTQPLSKLNTHKS